MTNATLTQGFSAEARFVGKSIDDQRRRFGESVTLGSNADVMDELATVAEECRYSDWDGYGAEPVTRDAMSNAYCFLDSLPMGYPRPSVGAEPDGHLTLEWYRDPRHTLSVSVSPIGDLHYAALFGPNRELGTVVFFGDVSEEILRLVRRVFE